MKFHTQLKANDIFKFSLAYTYSGLQLILAIAMVAVGVYMCVTGMGAADGQSNMIFGIVLIVLFVVVNPLMLYVKAKKQAIENPVYKMKTYYTLNEDGIFVELGEDSATIEWARVLKISHVMGLNILYTGRKQAFVFPDYALGEDKDKMLSYMKEHMEAIRTYVRGHNLFDIFYGKYKKEEKELLKKYIEIAPRKEFSDILDAADSFIYFQSKTKQKDK